MRHTHTLFNKKIKNLQWNSHRNQSSLFGIMSYKKAIHLVFILCLLFTRANIYAQPLRSDTVPKINSIQLSKIATSNIPDTSQIETDTIAFDPNVDLTDQLPTLDSLFKIAYINSPSLKFLDADHDRVKYTYEYTKRIWLNGVSAYYNFSYGNLFSSTATNYSDGQAQSLSLTNGYKLGVNIQFPLTELFGRPKRLKSINSEMRMSEYKKQEAFQELKRRIVSDYFNLRYNQTILKVRFQDVESARITSDLSEMEMKRGKVPPSEMSRYRNVLTIAEGQLELARRDFLISYYQFEALMGIKLNSIKVKPIQKFSSPINSQKKK